MTTRNESIKQVAHLTPEQFGEVFDKGMIGASCTAAENHLAACEQCTAEFNSMREALSLFRQSASAYADRELARPARPTRGHASFVPAHGGFSAGLLWAAAGLLVIAGAVPLELQRHSLPVPESSHTKAVASSESDEALLDDINRELSASVPDPMQALSDPTGSLVSAGDAETPTIRKN